MFENFLFKHGWIKGALAGIALLAVCSLSASAKIVAKDVEYRDGGTVLQGFVAYDDAKKGGQPGVVIFHEWDGPGEYVRARARRLAELGYVAFAADIYGKGVRPKTQEASAKEAEKYRADRALMRRRAQAGLDELKKQPGVDAGRLAAIGYCFGGGVALELARSGADIKGVVSFHGTLDTPRPRDAKNIKAAILALHGADDPSVPFEQVQAFMQEMREAGADWQLNVYSGAVHRFTNPAAGDRPESGAAYNEQADRRSWAAMRLFFDEIFAQ